MLFHLLGRRLCIRVLWSEGGFGVGEVAERVSKSRRFWVTEVDVNDVSRSMSYQVPVGLCVWWAFFDT